MGGVIFTLLASEPVVLLGARFLLHESRVCILENGVLVPIYLKLVSSTVTASPPDGDYLVPKILSIANFGSFFNQLLSPEIRIESI